MQVSRLNGGATKRKKKTVGMDGIGTTANTIIKVGIAFYCINSDQEMYEWWLHTEHTKLD